MRSLSDTWTIGEVEISGRVVLAPMAGFSVQAFRRQGRRFGAGLVCSEMVSACGLHYGSERTHGFLRIASDERPLAVQIFGSDPALMAEAARQVVEAGADIVDINMGCPVRKVTPNRFRIEPHRGRPRRSRRPDRERGRGCRCGPR